MYRQKMKNKSGLGSGITLFFAVILCVILIWVFMFIFKSISATKAPDIIADMQNVNSYLIMDNYLLSEVEEGNILTLINLHDTNRLETETARILNNFIGNKGRTTDLCWVVTIEFSPTDIKSLTSNTPCEIFRPDMLELSKTVVLMNQKSVKVEMVI